MSLVEDPAHATIISDDAIFNRERTSTGDRVIHVPPYRRDILRMKDAREGAHPVLKEITRGIARKVFNACAEIVHGPVFIQ